ncbi:MAG TPA: hypothetical protein VGT98_14785, partial [Candidatus Elarobacter sp.]|nr:hypothetical protein [Candidatus Elarobacter sp.]
PNGSAPEWYEESIFHAVSQAPRETVAFLAASTRTHFRHAEVTDSTASKRLESHATKYAGAHFTDVPHGEQNMVEDSLTHLRKPLHPDRRR